MCRLNSKQINNEMFDTSINKNSGKIYTVQLKEPHEFREITGVAGQNTRCYYEMCNDGYDYFLVQYVMDDYGNLAKVRYYSDIDENINFQWADDYGNGWVNVVMEEENKIYAYVIMSKYKYHYLEHQCFLTVYTAIETNQMAVEHGWEALHKYATVDGMLCVKWIMLYRHSVNPHHQSLDVNWGFKYENRFNMRADERNRGPARFTLENTPKETPAEVFPMEVGSILAAEKYNLDEYSLIGVIYCPHQSELRKIFSRDCYSYFSNREQKLKCDSGKQFRKDEIGYGWKSARSVYNSIPLKDRLNTYSAGKYTEGFVRDPKVGAVVVYGKMEYLTPHKKHVVEKFRKNGYDVYNLIPSI